MGLFLLNGQVERYSGAMKELVQRKVDAHPCLRPEAALEAAIAATDTLPGQELRRTVLIKSLGDLRLSIQTNLIF